MSLTIDCGEGRHAVCRGKGSSHYLIPQLNGEEFQCSCPCHERILLTEEEQAKFKGHGEATVENVTTGEKSKVEFSGEATVTSLEEKKQEKEGEHLCPECGDEQTRHGNRWICTNVSSCSLAQSQATSGSSRTTAKAVAASAPRAFSRSGRVD